MLYDSESSGHVSLPVCDLISTGGVQLCFTGFHIFPKVNRALSEITPHKLLDFSLKGDFSADIIS